MLHETPCLIITILCGPKLPVVKLEVKLFLPFNSTLFLVMTNPSWLSSSILSANPEAMLSVDLEPFEMNLQSFNLSLILAAMMVPSWLTSSVLQADFRAAVLLVLAEIVSLHLSTE